MAGKSPRGWLVTHHRRYAALRLAMKLSPYVKKVEVEAGYRGFYRVGSSKFTVTVEDSGIGVLVDERSGHPLSRGTVVRLFKPMISVWAGRKYAEAMGALTVTQLLDASFIEVGRFYD